MKKSPFFARFLESQSVDAHQIQGGKPFITHKFPSDLDEAMTMKYPSDDDEATVID